MIRERHEARKAATAQVQPDAQSVPAPPITPEPQPPVKQRLNVLGRVRPAKDAGNEEAQTGS